MEIKEIVIQTDDLKGTENFYANVLGFELIKKEQNTIAFSAGNSMLSFIKSTNLNPKYHFAFNIPKNKLNEATIWLNSKVNLLLNDENEIITEFGDWNAKAIYFYDNNNNIVEFITRFDLTNETEKKFDASSVLSISEIGIVANDPMKLASQIMDKNHLNYFEKGKQSENFISIGDDNGLFIIVKNDRKWYPTEQKAEQHVARVKIISKGIKHDVVV
jgi:catechol-2,3-dioxygenase